MGYYFSDHCHNHRKRLKRDVFIKVQLPLNKNCHNMTQGSFTINSELQLKQFLIKQMMTLLNIVHRGVICQSPCPICPRQLPEINMLKRSTGWECTWTDLETLGKPEYAVSCSVCIVAFRFASELS